MKKKALLQNTPVYKKQQQTINKVEEPMAVYSSTVKVIPSLHDFTFDEFKKIAANAPFTTYDGIQKVLTQLARIQQGLFA